MTIHSDYEQFLEAQSHVAPQTLKLMRKQLSKFPEPDSLNSKWFRQRSKSVRPATLKGERNLARQILRFLDMDVSELDGVKIPRDEGVTVEDLYTREELDAIFRACSHTRDRALLKVLYESATRASELLSMTFENTHFSDDGTAMAFVRGKTGTREIYLKESVPALNTWLNVHPVAKGPIWVTLKSPHKPVTYSGLFQVVKRVIHEASLKRPKRKIVHMFRHTRITELVKLGVRGQMLSKVVGWSKLSNMEAVYVHLSTLDVENEVRTKVFGFEHDESTSEPLLKSSTCPRCGIKNDQQTIFCSACNMPLSNDAIVKALEIETLVQRRVDESMERVVQAFTAAIESLDTEVLKDLALAFSREMKRDPTLTDKDES